MESSLASRCSSSPLNHPSCQSPSGLILTAGSDFSTPAAFDAVAAFAVVSLGSLVEGALIGGFEGPFFGGVVGLLEDNSLGGRNASIGPLSSVDAVPP